jgi:CubicO group peptidase (beta-lactamase class C family)
MGKIGMLFLSLFLVPTIGSTLSDRKFTEFSTYLEKVVKCKQVPAGVVTVVERGRTVFTKSFGYYDIDKTRKVTDDTKFCLGSLTKAFTSAVIAKLLSQQNR